MAEQTGQIQNHRYGRFGEMVEKFDFLGGLIDGAKHDGYQITEIAIEDGMPSAVPDTHPNPDTGILGWTDKYTFGDFTVHQHITDMPEGQTSVCRFVIYRPVTAGTTA